MKFLEQLNEKQKEAVLETEGYVRVIAGAGSGKTKLLVSRYAYLVKAYGIDPANILCVTFTNKAAGEMKKRIKALVGAEYDTTLICTYHGFCNRLLRENPEKLFLTKQFQIIDGTQQKAILAEIYQKYELRLDHANFESIVKKIGEKKADISYVKRMCDPGKVQILSDINSMDERIIEEYLQRQKATYCLDFYDLISFALYLLTTDAKIREKWQNKLNYIMVDEFQDSSDKEMELMDILSGLYHNLMVVGDPDQNIYEWRGSDVGLLVDFDKDHENTKTIFLNQNYRSTPQILTCANTLITKNRYRLEKDLFTKNLDGEKVRYYHCKDDLEKMDKLIQRMQELQKKEDYKYSDFAILYRSSYLSRKIEKKLLEKNIPYEIYGSVKFFQRMEVQDVIAYLRVIAYEDDIAFKRIINTPRRRFGRIKMQTLLQLQETKERETGERESLYQNLLIGLEQNLFEQSDVSSFVKMMEVLKARKDSMSIAEIVNEVCANSGYERYIRELGDAERLDNLAEFKRMANEFEQSFGEDLSLEEYLDQIALLSGEDKTDKRDCLKMMTIHASKGLEFPVVFLVGMSEGIFPSAKTMEERNRLGLEEERRLCYVAITRAQKYLHLMDSEGVSHEGNRKVISRFIKDIKLENLEQIGIVSEELWRDSDRYATLLGYMEEEGGKQRKVGDIVEHPVFGKGTILEIDDKRGSYTIRFEKLSTSRNISKTFFDRK